MNKHRIALALGACLAVAFGVVLTLKIADRLDHLEAVAQETVQRASNRPPRPPPRFVTPEPGPATEIIRLSGTLRPEAEVDLAFKLPGRVLEVLVARGEVVRAGQVLARLDGRDLEAQAAQARAGMQAARAQRELASDALRRSKNLQEAGAASEQQVFMAGGQADLGQASIAQAGAAARLVASMREETRLVAPIDGVVVRAPTAPGFFAAPGVPLFRIEKLARVRFAGHLSDGDAARVQPGARLTIETDAGVRAEGRLDVIIPSVDPATRRVPIEGLLDNADGRLFAGTFVQATLEVRANAGLFLPQSALVTGEVPAVLVAGGDGRVVRREVQVVRSEAGSILVRSGVTATDRVIAAPGAEWREGDKLPATATAAATPKRKAAN